MKNADKKSLIKGLGGFAFVGLFYLFAEFVPNGPWKIAGAIAFFVVFITIVLFSRW